MKDAKNINVSIVRPGFKNILSNLFGQIAAVAIIAIIGTVIVIKVFQFLWPTIKWLVPLSLFFVYVFFMLYKITKMNEDEARDHNQFKITLVLTRAVLVLIIFLYDIESVAG